MTRPAELRAIVAKINEKTRELHSRASYLVDLEMNGSASDSDLEMMRDSASSVDFWIAELERAVIK